MAPPLGPFKNQYWWLQKSSPVPYWGQCPGGLAPTSHTNLVTVRDLVARSFKSDDIFSAWSKLREACQLAADHPVVAPPKHRAELKLAEELVKEVSETEKSGNISLVIPATELGVVRGLLDLNVGDERPVASRLESLEDG
jgi:hypothetical protein